MKVSLIISVYKNVADLRIVLDGLKFQTYRDFEIIISEDGMDPAMKSFLESYSWSNRMVHSTQPDLGWRKNAALNRAIKKSSGEYLIFIDGDCVLHHKFIENHVKYSDENRILAGKCVKLGPRYSNIFRANINDLPLLEKQIMFDPLGVRRDGAKFYEEAFYVDPHGPLAFIPKVRKIQRLKGCNMSFFKDSIELINGFDEDYRLPAVGEDIDLTWRFKGLGFELFSMRNIAVQYHLDHVENWVDQVENQRLMKEKQSERRLVCRSGLKKYSVERIFNTRY